MKAVVAVRYKPPTDTLGGRFELGVVAPSGLLHRQVLAAPLWAEQPERAAVTEYAEMIFRWVPADVVALGNINWGRQLIGLWEVTFGQEVR